MNVASRYSSPAETSAMTTFQPRSRARRLLRGTACSSGRPGRVLRLVASDSRSQPAAGRVPRLCTSRARCIRVSIQDWAVSADSLCSNLNFSAQATIGRNSNWS